MIKQIVALILAFLIIACSKKNETCSVKEIDGVKYYSNKNIPADSTVKLKLENEKILVSCEKYNMKLPVDAIIDKNGNIYILSESNSQIHKFNKELNYVNSFGRLGDGPGEFKECGDIQIVNKDSLVAYDNSIQKEVRFDLNGNFIEFKNYATTSYPVESSEVDSSSYISTFLYFDQERGITSTELNLCGKNFLKLKNIATCTLKDFPGTNLAWRLPAFTVGKNSFFVSSYSEDEYLIKEYNMQGKLLAVISKQYKKESFNYKGEKRANYFNTKFKRSVSKLLYYEDKLLAVRTIADTKQQEDSLLSIDIFKDGLFLNNVKINKPHLFDIFSTRRFRIIGNKFVCLSLFDNVVYLYDITISK